jgi:hypothetical protein
MKRRMMPLPTQYWSYVSTVETIQRTGNKRGMNIEEVASVVDINLNILPETKRELDETCKALARKQVDLDILDEEEKRSTG